MAKKKAKKKEVILEIKEDEWRIAVDSVIRLEAKVSKFEQRIDRIVDAIDKSKSLKGL